MKQASPRSLRDADGRYQRPALAASGPDRSLRHYYSGGGKLLDKPEQLSIEVVRSAYRIADRYLDRGTRLVQRLKTAGDTALGANSELQALDAAERLSLKLMTTTLEWLEATAAEPGSPIRRLAQAQYRLVGSLFGVGPEEGPATAPAPAPAPAAAGHTRAARGRDAAPRIVLAGAVRRPVRLVEIELHGALETRDYACDFYAESAQGVAPMEVTLVVAPDRSRTLRVTPRADCPAGRWTAAVCDGDGVQLGVVEVRL